ncbi:MAG TPA: DUF1592 domain-containing protein [Vicinamibacterales bacterium]|nr:DUF1592 domain-containing protein [Vicinamibacterales bacterium]
MPQKTLVTGFVLTGIAIWGGALMSAEDAARAQSAPAFITASKTIDTYCVSCHNGRLRAASGTLLDQLDVTRIAANPVLWSRAYRQLQAGAMPPGGAPRPDRATAETTLVAIEHALGAQTKRPATADREIGTRLASMLWNSAPDAELLKDAEQQRLSDRATLEQQVQRMLADDRAQTFVSRFFVPWLQLDALATADPDTKYFPEYEVSLRDSLAKETELFLSSQLREDRDPVELWNANYSFLNEQLARHYGIPNVTGPQFRRTPLPTPERAGLLGQGSILMVTSRHEHGVDAAYTTPATRAKWIRLHFFGAPLPNGFPGAQPVRPELPITPQTRTLAVDPCVNCHRDFFPLGYALEHFDPLGRWRTHDQIGPVDASGAFVDGTPIDGAVDLRRVLLQYPEAFRTTITEKLLIFAAAGSVAPTSATPDSLVRARRILRSTPNPRWSTLIAAVVQ